jgi:uncharacterized protein (DUF1015 family)
MLRMDTTPDGTQRLTLHPFRALRLRDSFIGAAVAHRVFARPYRSVPGRLRDWRRKRHLQVDGSPGIYVHEYTSNGVSVRGLVATLELTTAAGVVLPHEDVHPSQVTQLASRMREMRLNPAPILLMHRGRPELRAALSTVLADRPRQSFTDRGEQLHRIWRISDPAVIDEVVAALGHPLVIADGHHRFAAAQELQRADPGTGWDRTLVMLVDQEDTPLQLGAIHRSITGLTLADVEAAARRSGDVFTRHSAQQPALDRLEHELVLHDGRNWATLAPHDSKPLLVCNLHDDLLPAWHVSESRLEFHHSAAEALAKADTGLAVLLPAPTFDQVEGAASAGVLLPQKATSFQPKPHLGAIMRDLRDE